MFAYRMVIVMLRRELPPSECCTLWEIQWALEAADAAAGVPAPEPLAFPRTSSAGSTTAGMAAAAGFSSSSSSSSALKSTIQGLGDAASPRAAAEAGAAASNGRASSDSAAAGPSRSGSVAGVAGGPARSGSTTALVGVPSRRPTSSSNSHKGEAEPPEFMLQFIAAVVRSQRGRIMGECRDHDDVLRLFSAVRIDFWLALAQARKQHKAYRQGSLIMQRLA